ncbi:MAG TPA: hypothetical protein VHJ19_05640 [Gammaproteobacteria bacterium]|jgi:hypothetical protein|nr:hypothetical protein [Gammaproteobacteria bacterium]
MLEAEMTTDTGFAADRTVDLGHQAALICTEFGGPYGKCMPSRQCGIDVV